LGLRAGRRRERTGGSGGEGRRPLSSRGTGPGHEERGKEPKLRTPIGTTGQLDAEARRRLKAYNVALATVGHLLALVILLVMSWIGTSDLDRGGWLRLTGLMLLVQTGLWTAARRGWDEAVTWDRHFLHVPILVSGALFCLYIHLAPAARYMLLMAWFVALFFAVGRLGFREVAGLAAVMATLYVGTVWHLIVHEGEALSLAFEGVHAGVFLAVNLYAGLVFERLRNKRRETHQLRETLAEQAITDPLTGLPNRRYMEEFLEAELGRIRRYGGECAVAMVDVDDFKHYNDSLGHLAGDEVLRMLAEAMQEDVRVSDVVARFGGEEFGIIMVNTGPEEAAEAAERLRRKVEERTFPDEEIQPGGDLTVSVGYACCPRDGEAYRELIERADEALYDAKRRGKNRIAAA
jgi:diguanylate cyclase (GGDEF)-like protein